MVQSGTYLQSAANVRQLVVAVRGDAAGSRKPVFMGDVARVEEGRDQPAKYVWFGSKDGEVPAVTVQISKKPGVNATDVANGVINRVATLKGALIPDGVEVTVTRNYGATATKGAETDREAGFCRLCRAAGVFYLGPARSFDCRRSSIADAGSNALRPGHGVLRSIAFPCLL